MSNESYLHCITSKVALLIAKASQEYPDDDFDLLYSIYQ